MSVTQTVNVLTHKQKEFIKKNIGIMTNGKIAETLNVRKWMVNNYIHRNGLSGIGIRLKRSKNNSSFQAKNLKKIDYIKVENFEDLTEEYDLVRGEISKGRPRKELTVEEQEIASSIFSKEKSYLYYVQRGYKISILRRIVRTYKENGDA